jgi:hypothetical protein
MLHPGGPGAITLLSTWSGIKGVDILARHPGKKESDRQRGIGALVLGLGLVAAAAFYATHARPAPPVMDDLLPGYARAQEREMGQLMGHAGVLMLEWQDALDRPGVQAALIAAASALLASYFFRVASVMDHEARHADASTDTPDDTAPRPPQRPTT